MESFDSWCLRECDESIPWLVLGKGPSLADIGRFNRDEYYVLGLNHVGRELPVDVAHAIDLDVIRQCGEEISVNANYVVMPWHPHIENAPSSRTLEDFVSEIPVLRRLNSEGRLLFYNHSLATDHHPGLDVVRVRYFSAEAAINLLASVGVRVIRTLGIDGGREYSKRFEDLNDVTLLSNGRSSFDAQFKEFSNSIMRYGLDLSPLNIQSPIKIFVATTEVQMLAVKVLEYSIKKHASMSVEVVPLHQVGAEVPMPKDISNHPRTPFSFQRFLIPKACEYQGRAIYLDSDMQVFKDIRKLWQLDFEGTDLLAAYEPVDTGRKPQFSVMLLDCEKLCWDVDEIVKSLDSGRLTYETLMYEMSVAKNIAAEIDPSWNSLERYEEGHTALLHYTDMNTQPWVSKYNPLGYLWFRDLFEAIDDGVITLEYIQAHIEKGWVRPSIWYQIENRIEDSFLLPRRARQLDSGYEAPYQGLHAHGAKPWRNSIHLFKGLFRQFMKKTPYYSIKAKLRSRSEC